MSLFDNLLLEDEIEDLDNKDENEVIDEEIDGLLEDIMLEAIDIPSLRPQGALKISAKSGEVEFTGEKLFAEEDDDPDSEDSSDEGLFDEDFGGDCEEESDDETLDEDVDLFSESFGGGIW